MPRFQEIDIFIVLDSFKNCRNVDISMLQDFFTIKLYQQVQACNKRRKYILHKVYRGFGYIDFMSQS